MSVVSSLLSSRVSRFAPLVLGVALAGAAGAATNDLDVARQALRDGFWSLARTRAHECARAQGEARLIVLESWAREGKWAEIPKSLDSWGNPPGDPFAYYRALALAKSGEGQAARDALAVVSGRDPVYARLSARLSADLALSEGDPAAAVKTLSAVPRPEADDKLLLAEANRRLGAEKTAALLWREVLVDTNATERTRVTAAANLGDIATLRSVASNTVPSEVRSIARLRLGTLLLPEAGRFDEGARLIRSTVSESPDTEGALEAAQALAAARLRLKDWSGAATGYSEILEIWPAAARLTAVQQGLGRALLKQGKSEDALQAFRRAEECAATDGDRATAAARTADALAALGRVDESTAKCREVIVRWPSSALSKTLAQTVRLRELEADGRALYARFRFAEAQKAFHEVGAGDAQRRGRMTFFEVLCLYGQGRDDEALALARRLAKETDDPRLRADVTHWLARAAYNDGRWREAKDLFVSYAVSPLVLPADAADARVWAARAALSANDFSTAISLAAEVVSAGTSGAQAEALIVQGEALIELARFDEAVLVFERAALVADISEKNRLEAQILRADALYAMGADNPTRYEEALAAYRTIAQQERIPDEFRLTLAYKIGVALEKLKRKDEAIDQYYTHVVLAYREARQNGRRLDDESRAVFARAAFRLADLCESGGHFLQAQKTLELVAGSDVPAADEARTRIERLRAKGILP